MQAFSSNRHRHELHLASKYLVLLNTKIDSRKRREIYEKKKFHLRLCM